MCPERTLGTLVAAYRECAPCKRGTVHLQFTFLCTNFYLTNKKYPLQIIVNCISYIVHTSWYERVYGSLSLSHAHTHIFSFSLPRATPLAVLELQDFFFSTHARAHINAPNSLSLTHFARARVRVCVSLYAWYFISRVILIAQIGSGAMEQYLRPEHVNSV